MLLSAIAAAASLQPQTGTNPVTDRRIDRNPPVQVTPPARAPETAQLQTAGSDVPINTIVFRGAEAPAPVADAARAFLERPATRETLVELAAALSRAYEKTDVALFTVSIPDQDFRDGTLIVDLIEGWVDSVAIQAPEGARFPLLEAQAGKLVGENPLSRARFERQSSLMQSIPGLELDASLENPEGDDSVQLVLAPRQKRVEGAIGITNRGPSLLGDVVLQAGVDFYRLLTDGDRLSFSGYATPNFSNYRAADATYAFPVGVSGLTLSATGGWIRTRARNVDIRGEAKFGGLTLTYPLIRRAGHAADISVAIDGVNSDNALFGNVFATERTRAARIAGAFAAMSDQTTFQASGSVSKGIDIFGASAGDTGAEIGFAKFNASIAVERFLTTRLLGRVSAVAQYSGDALPASELMIAGGAALGRAFDTGIVTGDRGIGGLAEIAYRPIGAGDFSKSETYAFVDAASLRIKSRLGFAGQSFSLASAGAGVRAKYKDRMELGAEAAAVLDRPYAGYGDDYRLSVYYSVLF